MPLKLKDPNPPRSPYFRVRGTYLGVYLDRSTGTRDRAVARRFLIKWKSEIESGRLRSSEGPTFSEAAVAYMKWGGEKRFLPKLLHYFGDTPIERITQGAVDDAAFELYPSGTPATLNRAIYTPVSAIINHATPDRPVRFHRPKQPTGRTLWATPEQAEALLSHMKPKLRRLALFLLGSGCRISEATSLDWAQIDLDASMAFIAITKNGEPRAVHLTPPMVEALEEIPAASRTGSVFGYKTRWSVSHRWREATSRADLAWLSPHVMRHTWATWMRRYAGADISDLVHTGAWRSIKSAMRYVHTVQAEESRKSERLPIIGGRVKSGGRGT